MTDKKPIGIRKAELAKDAVRCSLSDSGQGVSTSTASWLGIPLTLVEGRGAEVSEMTEIDNPLDRIEEKLGNIMTDEELEDIQSDIDEAREIGMNVSQLTSQLSSNAAQKLDGKDVYHLYEYLTEGRIEDVRVIEDVGDTKNNRIAVLIADSEAEEMEEMPRLGLTFGGKL